MKNVDGAVKKPVCMIAHRGYSGSYPQNTELAFVKAHEHSSGGAETDIRITLDGIAVCSHNSEAVLKDGSVLEVGESTYAALTSQPLLNEKTADEVYLCTFRRYLQLMKSADMICFIELKGDFDDAREKQVMDIIDEEYDVSKCILQSFVFDNLVRLHKSYPSLPLMFTYGTAQTEYERCFEYGFSIDADKCVITEEMVDAFHSRGLETGVWTCNTKESLDRALALGVDYIESDVFGGRDVLSSEK